VEHEGDDFVLGNDDVVVGRVEQLLAVVDNY
jgi:hypothetical protein